MLYLESVSLRRSTRNANYAPKFVFKKTKRDHLFQKKHIPWSGRRRNDQKLGMHQWDNDSMTCMTPAFKQGEWDQLGSCSCPVSLAAGVGLLLDSAAAFLTALLYMLHCCYHQSHRRHFLVHIHSLVSFNQATAIMENILSFRQRRTELGRLVDKFFCQNFLPPFLDIWMEY